MGYYDYTIDACSNLPTDVLVRLKEDFENLDRVYLGDWDQLIVLSAQYNARIRVLECGDDEDVNLGQPNMCVRFFDAGEMIEIHAKIVSPPSLLDLKEASIRSNFHFQGWGN